MTLSERFQRIFQQLAGLDAEVRNLEQAVSEEPIISPPPPDPGSGPVTPDPVVPDPVVPDPVLPPSAFVVEGIAKDADLILFSFDGNNNDDDDISAMPVAAAMVNAAGLQGNTTFLINNSRDEADVAWQVEAMRSSAEFVRRMGIPVLDYAADEAGTLAKLVAILSSGKKILSLEGGPMGTIYRALQATPTAFHANVTLVSHSQWNENRDNSGENKKWNAMKERFPGVTYIDISDQNGDRGNEMAPGFWKETWNRLDAHETSPVLKAMREKMLAAKEKVNDASDAGMMYYALTGKQDGNVRDLLALFEVFPPRFTDGTPIVTPPVNPPSTGGLPPRDSNLRELEPGLYLWRPLVEDDSQSAWKNETRFGVEAVVYRGPRAIEQPNAEIGLESWPRTLAPGTYQIQAVSSLEGTEPSQFNDTWLNVYQVLGDGEDEFEAGVYAQRPGGQKIYAQDNEFNWTPVTPGKNDSKLGWMKIYINHDGIGKFGTQTSAIDNNPTPVFIDAESGEELFIALKGRDRGHAIAAVFLRRVDLPASAIDKYVSQILNQPTPPTDPGTGPEPDPVTPEPVTPGAITAEIVSRGRLTPGARSLFEVVVSDPSQVQAVEISLNGTLVQVERAFKYEATITVPNTEFTMSAKVLLKNGAAALAASKVFVPVTVTPPPTGGGGEPEPLPGTSVAEWDNFVASADGTWFDFDANTSNMADGYQSNTATLRSEFGASTEFIGMKYNGSRFKFESAVPEMGNIPALLMYTPPGANNANFQERVSVPKDDDKDYTPGRQIALATDFFFLPTAAKTGNVDTDIRTYWVEGHVKRNGLQTFGDQPGPGTNPVPDGQGCEFVTMSQYDAGTFSNNFPRGDKGDPYGLLSRPEGFTTFDMAGTYEGPFSTSSDTYTKHRMILACGIYGHFITDYDYQSQAFPCYPGTNIRMTFAPGVRYRMRWLIGTNTVTNGVSNSDGYFRWWIQAPNVNNGEWFLACFLDNIDCTGNVPMLFANWGIGQYYGGQGKGYYLANGTLGNGLWFTKHAAHYKVA